MMKQLCERLLDAGFSPALFCHDELSQIAACADSLARTGCLPPPVSMPEAVFSEPPNATHLYMYIRASVQHCLDVLSHAADVCLFTGNNPAPALVDAFAAAAAQLEGWEMERDDLLDLAAVQQLAAAEEIDALSAAARAQVCRHAAAVICGSPCATKEQNSLDAIVAAEAAGKVRMAQLTRMSDALNALFANEIPAFFAAGEPLLSGKGVGNDGLRNAALRLRNRCDFLLSEG